MKHLFITILLLLPLCRMLAQEREYVIVVHGGDGAMENLEDDKEKSTLYYAALDSALSIGNAILSAGGEGPEAVMAVVRITPCSMQVKGLLVPVPVLLSWMLLLWKVRI